MHLIRNVHYNLVVHARRGAKAGSPIVGPINPDAGLFRRPFGGGGDAVATEAFYFVVTYGVFETIQCWRWRDAKLAALRDNERFYPAPIGTDCQRYLADRVLTPLTR